MEIAAFHLSHARAARRRWGTLHFRDGDGWRTFEECRRVGLRGFFVALQVGEEDDAVASLGFGFVEGGIGSFEQVGFEAGLFGEEGDADADGHVLGFLAGGGKKVGLLDGRTQTLSHELCALEVGFGEQEDELLAAIARGGIDLAQLAGEDGGKVAQHDVADVVAKACH